MNADDTRLARRIERRVLRFIDEERLLAEGAGVLLAVSGGQDSLALLHLLARLGPRLGLTLAVAYVDHGIRPAAAVQAERRFVAEQAAALALPFLRARSGPGGGRGSPEEAARRGRYAALARLAPEAGATHVATGHTRSDQAETVLLRLLRGAGLRGLT